jgi:hypothetical protein
MTKFNLEKLFFLHFINPKVEREKLLSYIILMKVIFNFMQKINQKTYVLIYYMVKIIIINL